MDMDGGDPFAQYEDDGAPVDRQDILDVQSQIRDLVQQQQRMMMLLQQQVQQQVQQQAMNAQGPFVPQGQLPQGQHQEKLPEPPSFGSDDPEEDAKITSKMFTIYWLKIQMWIALVEGRIVPQRFPALIANRLKGKAADAVWLGGGEALTQEGGLTLMKSLLDAVFFGDQTAAISNQVGQVLDFHRPAQMSLRDFCTEMRSRLQQLDSRGETIPAQTRGHILLTNAGLTADQRGLILATTQRNMGFNPISDAMCLLFGDAKPRSSNANSYNNNATPGHSFYSQSSYTGNRGKGGGKGGKGEWQQFTGTCYNCGITGHKSADCYRPSGGGGSYKGKGGKSGKGGKGTSTAMVARDGAQVRGATLSSDERLNQLEELLSKFEFVGMSRAVENAYLAKSDELATKAIVDSGCTSNVCSLTWLRRFEAIMQTEYPKVKINDGVKTFIFGAGDEQRELFRVSLNVTLFGHFVQIVTSVVDSESTPFLLSRRQLEEWDAVIGVRDNILTLKLDNEMIKYTAPCSSSNLMLLDLVYHRELVLP